MEAKNHTADLGEAAAELGRRIPFLLAPTAFRLEAAAPTGAIQPPEGRWTCIFSMMREVQAGAAAAFSRERPGCTGAMNYFGFREVPVLPAALFLSGKERLKREVSLAQAFYESVRAPAAPAPCLVFSTLGSAPRGAAVEVVNLWVDANSLAALHTLANYDRATNDNVIMPFSSGCQSIWTLPFQEKGSAAPRAVAGSLDPTVRGFLPEGAISFSVTAGRLLEMAANVPGSFLDR
ncbi:MAG: DUF169 domain-containing protein [Pseudomonadota bacterium]